MSSISCPLTLQAMEAVRYEHYSMASCYLTRFATMEQAEKSSRTWQEALASESFKSAHYDAILARFGDCVLSQTSLTATTSCPLAATIPVSTTSPMSATSPMAAGMTNLTVKRAQLKARTTCLSQ